MSEPKALGRRADFIIGGEDNPYLYRWWVIPRNRWFNVYLHKIVRDDDDRALHDHPWWNVSIILKGCYWEVLGPGLTKFRKRGSMVFRRPTAAHRLVVRNGWGSDHPGECWTLFITGPRVREWGFLCPNGWRHWKDFTAAGDSARVGRGCDD